MDPLGSYVVIDREEREPAQLWAAAERRGPAAVAGLVGEYEYLPVGSGVLVALDEPLGERRVVGLDHAGCTVERPAFSSMAVAGDHEVDRCIMPWEIGAPSR